MRLEGGGPNRGLMILGEANGSRECAPDDRLRPRFSPTSATSSDSAGDVRLWRHFSRLARCPTFVRNAGVTGHLADMSESTRMTQTGPRPSLRYWCEIEEVRTSGNVSLSAIYSAAGRRFGGGRSWVVK